jgi:CMP-N,N'-diacetyllegionaminic acid synthase
MSFRGQRVFALVPARGGSKGIPGKNLRRIDGETLVARAAAIARAVPSIDRAVLSTDDPDIAAEGRRAGLDVPFIRPAELAGDCAKSVDMWRHAWLALEAEEGRRYELSVLLEPTSPLRRAADVEATLARLLDTGAKAATTVSHTPGHFTPHKTLTIDAAGRIGFFLPEGARFARRQDIPACFHRNGACYAVRRATIVDDRTLVESDCAAVVIDRAMVNIDEPIDLEIAEFLLDRERRLNRE